MPTYQYRCTECDHAFEEFQSFTDDALTVCPVCGGRLRKVFNAVGVVFKGSGFYRNDSRSKSSSSTNGATVSMRPSDLVHRLRSSPRRRLVGVLRLELLVRLLRLLVVDVVLQHGRVVVARADPVERPGGPSPSRAYRRGMSSSSDAPAFPTRAP